MIACECCGEKFYTLDSHVEHGGPFTCCKRKNATLTADLDAARREIARWKQAYLEEHADRVSAMKRIEVLSAATAGPPASDS
jgi:hypothetical protein